MRLSATAGMGTKTGGAKDSSGNNIVQREQSPHVASSLVRWFPSSGLGTMVSQAPAWRDLWPLEAGASKTAFPSWSLGTSGNERYLL
jgi:hypothetical protein